MGKNIFNFIVIPFLFFIVCNTLYAQTLTVIGYDQPQIDVQLWVRYASTDSQELHFGFDQLATHCMDAVFGEVGAPPPPPNGIFDARLSDPRGYDEFCLADGVYRDFRYLDIAMTDTFEIDMLPASGTSHSPYALSWSAGLSQLMQSCQLKDVNDNLIADMLTTQAVSIPYNSRMVILFIYALPKSSLPAIPKLVSPSNGSTYQPLTPTLIWTTSVGASQYQLQVSTNSNFNSIVFDDSTVTDTSKQIGPLTKYTKYYWRVRGKNTVGLSAWSKVWNFTTADADYVQPQIDVQLWVRYADTDSQEMHFGFDQLAIHCLDPMFYEVTAPPPPPAGIFDARLTDPRGYDEFCLADGVYRDFRYLDVAMTDTFELDLLPASGTSHSPYALSWSAGLSQLMQSCQLKDVNDNLIADMLTTQAVSIPYNSRMVSVFIYALPKSSLPAIPKLVSPTIGSTYQPLMPTLRWTTSFNASQYQLQVSTNSNFTTIVFDDSTVTDTLKQIGPLTEYTTYYWRVRGKNTVGLSAWSKVWNFTTADAHYVQPQIEVQLWVRYADTDSQELHFGFDQLATHCRDTLFHELEIPPLPPPGVFDARFNDPRGFDVFCFGNGVVRDFRYLDIAMTDTFEIDMLPASGTSHSPYALSWSAGLSQLMQSCQLKDINDNLIADMLTTQAVSIPYNSRMVMLFIYALPKSSLPAIPRLVSPANGYHYQPLMPTLRWTTSFGASQYQLQVSTNSNFISIVFDDSTITDTSKQIGPLNEYTTYYWRVRGKNTVGLSAWSKAWNFTTADAHYVQPQIDVQLWVRYADTDSQELYFGFDKLATHCLDSIFREIQLPPDPPGWFDTRLVDPTGFNDTCLGLGVYNDYRYLNDVSPLDSFEIHLCPTQTSQSPFRLSWTLNNDQFVKCEMRDYKGNSVADMLATQAVSIPYSSRAVILFIYAIPKSSLPAIPNLLSPANGSINQPLMPTLRWTTSVGASQYQLQVSANSNFTSMVFDDSTITGTSKQIGPLTEYTTYYWRVRAKNLMGISAWSNTWNFTTTGAHYKPQIDVQMWARYANTDPLELHFGFDKLATRCLDYVFDEWWLAFPPAGIFDVRFTDPRGYDEFCMYDGVDRDFRYLDPAMTDTFELDLVPASTSQSPYALSWSAGLSQLMQSCQLKDMNDNLIADMLTTQAVSIPYRRFVTLFIYALPKEPTDVKHVSDIIPNEFVLEQNYPNPFNPSTILRYGIPSRSYVKLEIINTLGQIVATLVNSEQEAGYYAVEWQANVGSGIYFCRIQAVNSTDPMQSYTQARKMLLLR
jgi:hypothetical protein